LFVYIFEMVISSGLDNQLKYVNEQRRKSVESLCSVFEKKISVTVGLTIEIKLRFHFFQSQHGRGECVRVETV